MTTTELIELLKKYEKGGVTGRPREINFYVTDSKYQMFVCSPEIIFRGCGDGLITDILLEIKMTAKFKKERIKNVK